MVALAKTFECDVDITPTAATTASTAPAPTQMRSFQSLRRIFANVTSSSRRVRGARGARTMCLVTRGTAENAADFQVRARLAKIRVRPDANRIAPHHSRSTETKVTTATLAGPDLLPGWIDTGASWLTL